MSIVMEVEELIVPLRDYSQGILEEGHDDEEAADGWQISVYMKAFKLAPCPLFSRHFATLLSTKSSLLEESHTALQVPIAYPASPQSCSFVPL